VEGEAHWPHPLMHKVVSLISALLYHQMALPVRHPPQLRSNQ